MCGAWGGDAERWGGECVWGGGGGSSLILFYITPAAGGIFLHSITLLWVGGGGRGKRYYMHFLLHWRYRGDGRGSEIAEIVIT